MARKLQAGGEGVYLISTPATPSNFFLMVSASSFRDVLLQWLGGAVDQVLGFLQTERGDLAYRRDGVDLISAGVLQNDGELGLFFDRSRPPPRHRQPP